MSGEAMTHLAAFSSMLAHDKAAGRLGTRHVQIVCLLCAQDAPMSTSAIATLGSIRTDQVSRMADKLVDHGLITREADRWGDRRLTMHAPTQAGRDLDARVRAHFVAATAPPDDVPKRIRR